MPCQNLKYDDPFWYLQLKSRSRPERHATKPKLALEQDCIHCTISILCSITNCITRWPLRTEKATSGPEVLVTKSPQHNANLMGSQNILLNAVSVRLLHSLARQSSVFLGLGGSIRHRDNTFIIQGPIVPSVRNLYSTASVLFCILQYQHCLNA